MILHSWTLDSLPAMLVFFLSHFQFTFGHEENHVARILFSHAHPLSPGFLPGTEGCYCRTVTNPLLSFPFMHFSFSLIFLSAESGSWGSIKSPISSKDLPRIPSAQRIWNLHALAMAFVSVLSVLRLPSHSLGFWSRGKGLPVGLPFSCNMCHFHAAFTRDQSLVHPPCTHASFKSSEAGSPHRVV